MINKLIYLIDDNSMTLTILERHLKNKGYQVAQNVGPQGALNSALKIKPQIIVMDLYMPDSNGYELLTKFKNHPELKNIPVIGYSASLFESDLERALEHGFDAVCSKEGGPESLLDVIKKCCA